MSIAPGYRGTDVIAKENELRMGNIKEFHYVEDENGKVIQLDSVVSSIINQFTTRALMGQKKYGVNLDRNDLTLLEWIEHAKQEHMDAILYLEKIKQIAELNEYQEKVI
jgi:hypothetical protein